MNQLKITWLKELKNSVSFFIFINGVEVGLMKRGDECTVDMGGSRAELYFVPKAPKWFGWKALKLQVEATAESSEITLAVQETPGNTIFDLSDAIDYRNQLHYRETVNLNVVSGEYIKNYK